MPKTVWTFWDKNELPPLIEDIKQNNARKLNGWDIKYLIGTDIDKYISKEEYPRKFETLSIQHKADWMRLILLKKYGGVWMDASIIVNENKALNTLYNDSVSINSQFTGFSYKTYESNTKSKRGISLYIENWFIMAPVNSIVIRLWLAQYERAIEIGFDNYRKILDSEGIDTSKVYNDPTDVYLTQHACLQYVLQKLLSEPVPPMIIVPAEETMFKIRYDCNNDGKCVMNKIKYRPDEVRKIPFIKLIGNERSSNIDISNYFSPSPSSASQDTESRP